MYICVGFSIKDISQQSHVINMINTTLLYGFNKTHLGILIIRLVPLFTPFHYTVHSVIIIKRVRISSSLPVKVDVDHSWFF